MRRYIAVVALLLLGGCSLLKVTLPAPTAAQARASARAAVDVSKDAWVTVARACIDASSEAKDDSIRLTCGKYLVPAHDLIVSAAEAVDSKWGKNDGCDLLQAAKLVEQAAESLGAISKQVAPIAQDAITVVSAMVGDSCPADAGAE